MGIDKNLLLYEFIVESKEFLTAIESDFLELEKYEDTVEPDLINRLFRAFHTIKGDANSIGMNTIGQLSHEVETMLCLMRSGHLRPNTDHIDIMLDSVDVLNIMLDDVYNSNSFDTTILLSRLKAMIEGCKTNDENIAVPINEKNTDSDKYLSLKNFTPFTLMGFEINDKIIDNCPFDHDFLYILEFEINDMEDKDKISIQLVNTGKVMEEKISSVTEENGLILFQLLFSTVLEDFLINLAISPPPNKLVEIKNNDNLDKIIAEDDISTKSNSDYNK